MERGGRNVKFHYYDRSFFSEHRNCLFSSSLLHHQNVESVFLVHHYIEKEKDHNVESVFLVHHYYDKNQTFDVLILPMASKKIATSKIKNIFLSNYLWGITYGYQGPWGGQVRVNQVRSGQVRLGQARLGSITLSQVRLGQVKSGQRVFKDLFVNAKKAKTPQVLTPQVVKM